MSDNMTMDAVFARLERSIDADNPNTAIHVVLKLGDFRDERDRVPDELIERLLTLIGTPRVLSSIVAATILQFFEFEARRFTRRQKRRCLEFLKSKLSEFKDADSLHMAYEVVEGNYLK
ncbi:MAG TPA: hypothetical protein VFP59_16385 [Candidatus Angelobacter sp.]|nr:hypothetical protein [Candidatus Angelobacter sp.]